MSRPGAATLALALSATLAVLATDAATQSPCSTQTRPVAPLPIHLIVDRIEGGHAVLEGPGGYVVVTVSQLPAGAREGHVLTARLGIDREATEARVREMEELRARLPRGPVGDLELP